MICHVSRPGRILMFLTMACAWGAATHAEEKARSTQEKLLRRIYVLELQLKAQALRSSVQASRKLPEQGVQERREDYLKKALLSDHDDVCEWAVLELLTDEFSAEVREMLLCLLTPREGGVAVTAARVLAFRSEREAIPFLQRTVKGETARSSSGFELGHAAFALLLLGEEIPRPAAELRGLCPEVRELIAESQRKASP